MWTVAELEYPKHVEPNKYTGFMYLPDIVEDVEVGDDTVQVIHPLVELFEAGKQIEALSVEEEWKDDHCPCFNIIVTVEGKKYGFAARWLNSSGVRLFYRAEVNPKEYNDEIVEYVLDTKNCYVGE